MAAKVTPLEGRWQRTPIRGERDWIPSTLDDLELVRQTLVDDGQPVAMVNAITGWLVAKALEEPDTTGPNTRARYRKILGSLESPIMHVTRVLSGADREALRGARVAVVA